MRSALLLVVVGLAAAMSTAAWPRTEVTTVIDRTLVCETGITGGIHKVDLIASSAIRQGPQKHDAEIQAVTRTSPFRLAGIGEGYMDLSPKCTRSTANVPLTSRGLIGGVASVFEDEYGCPTPQRVLLHVRAVFPSRAALRLGTPFPGEPRRWYTIGEVDEGAFAVRTLRGKPIAYASFSSATGKARLFTARSCG
jgi:hypothetical protein